MAVEYFALNVAAVGLCGLVLTRLDPRAVKWFPVSWLLLLFLLAYYAKFYLLVLSPEAAVMVHPRLAQLFDSPAILISAFVTMTCGLAGFAGGAYLMLSRRTRGGARLESKRPRISPSQYWTIGWIAGIVAAILIPATGVAVYATGISFMGGESVYLPFRLAGLIFYVRAVIIPSLVLLLFWCGTRSKSVGARYAALGLLAVHAAADGLLRSTKGGFFHMVAFIVALMLVAKVTPRLGEVGILAMASVVGLAVYPVVAEYRWVRLSADSGVYFSFQEAITTVLSRFPDMGGLLIHAAVAVWMRVTGVELLVVLTGLAIQPLGWKEIYVVASPGGLAEYVTLDVFGYASHTEVSVAPGMLGTFYLVGGNLGVALGALIVALVAQGLWRRLGRAHLAVLPVAQAMFMTLLITATTDGPLNWSLAWLALSWVSAAAAMEWLLRIGAGASRARSL